MKKLVQYLADKGFDRLSIWLCERSGGHVPIWYCQGLEPDMNCKYCPERG